jgi:hypothetical protein
MPAVIEITRRRSEALGRHRRDEQVAKIGEVRKGIGGVRA